jgi:uncharacterized protein (DUF2141 family)
VKKMAAVFLLLMFLLPLRAMALTGDVNGDGKVDMQDVMVVIKAFGSIPGTARWNAAADLNGDGRVDVSDIIIVLLNFGKT